MIMNSRACHVPVPPYFKAGTRIQFKFNKKDSDIKITKMSTHALTNVPDAYTP